MAGIEQRAQIDTETFKGLLAINGGGTIALLSFLAAILNKPNVTALAHAVLWGVLVMMLGVAAAVVHNHLRRRCSLLYEHHNGKPPAGRLLGLSLPSPIVCFCSWACMWISLASFLTAGLVVAVTGLFLV
jgi:hypothetical protein